MAEDYLRTKVRGIIEPMINALLMSAPDEPAPFMISWLQSYNQGQIYGVNSEKEELENLRKEIKRYKKQEELEREKEGLVESEKSDEDDEEDDQEQKEFDRKLQERQSKIKERGQRSSVSAEVYGKFNSKQDFVARVIPKTEEQKEAIRKKCLQSFIFNSLEDQDMATVVNAFEERKYKAGDYVIKQGEQGDVVYLVDKGDLNCEKVFKAGNAPTFLKTYVQGESFGELSLLYNAPRAATIRAKTNSVLWALDRETFNNIVKAAAIKKREKYEASLKSVPILSTLDAYELSQVCDAVRSHKASKGDRIINQNDKGDVFFILDEGKAYAAKIFKEGEKETKVLDYHKGDYFGELALLRNEPRAASVIAETDCKLLVLDRLAFKRLLGPLENLLQRNSETYLKYKNR